MGLFRRLRGALGTMAVWALVFASVGLAGLIPLSLLGLFPPFEPGHFLRMLFDVALRWGMGGAGMGLAFSIAILLGERKRSFAALSPRRFAAWGFAAGLVVPIGMAAVSLLTSRSTTAFNSQAFVVFAGICGVTSATLAAATLRAARRAPASLDAERGLRAPVNSVR
jgi:hypothetical protein